jgi:hypothetical protein
MSHGAESEDESQHAEIPAVQPTPLPKLQVFVLLFILFAEPVTGNTASVYLSTQMTEKSLALVIYPFIIQFVRDTGVTGGDESQTGHFAGLIVRALWPRGARAKQELIIFDRNPSFFWPYESKYPASGKYLICSIGMLDCGGLRSRLRPLWSAPCPPPWASWFGTVNARIRTV